MMEMAEADEVKAEAADDGDDDHMYARLLEGCYASTSPPNGD